MSNNNPQAQFEKTHIQVSLTHLRPFYASGTPDLEILADVLSDGKGALTPEALLTYAKSRKQFSTANVMQTFQASKYKVAGSLAALSRSKKIEKLPELDPNGYSFYRFLK